MMRSDAIAQLRNTQVALLTTFRRNGQEVGTPVGISYLKDKLYFTTWSTTGKVKRLSANVKVSLAPCTRKGDVTGSTVEGTARRLEGAEAAQISSQLSGAVRRWLWIAIYRIVFRAKPVLYEVTL